jgi:hypothetical protein
MPNQAARQLQQAQVDAFNSNGVSVACFTSPTLISDTVSLASLTLYTLNGYAEQSTTFSAAALDATGTNATASSGTTTFALSATISSVTIQGVAYTYSHPSGSNELIGLVLLPNGPLVISQIGDNVTSQLQISDQRAAGQP